MRSLHSGATDIDVSIWDDRKKPSEAPPLLFVHGSGPTCGKQAFEKQRPLAAKYKVQLVDRRGFGESPSVRGRGDFAQDAHDIVNLLEENCKLGGTHVVGHSYGAIGCMLAATERPDMVSSLTVIEPPLFNLVRNQNEFVAGLIKRLELNFSRACDPETKMSPREYWTEFSRIGGFEPHPEFFESVSESQIRGIKTSMTERPPWEAEVPFEELANSHFAKMVVSGGWNEEPLAAKKGIGAAYMLVCKVLQTKLNAVWAAFDAGSHSPQQLGDPFNKRLIEFLDPKAKESL